MEASGPILFRNVKIEPAEKDRKFELKADVAVKSRGNGIRPAIRAILLPPK
jgi:hypothetical protein